MLAEELLNNSPSRSEITIFADEEEGVQRRTISRDVSENEMKSHSRKSADGTGSLVVILKGLPFGVRDKEISDFLEPEIRVGTSHIHKVMNRDGKFKGDVFVELVSEEDVESALAKHRKHIGSRYVEVFRSSLSEMQRSIGSSSGGGGSSSISRNSYGMQAGGVSSSSYAVERAPEVVHTGRGGEGGGGNNGNNFVQLRGLPFMVKEEEIRSFLSGCEVLQDGILFGPPNPDVMRRGSTCNGDAFVELGSDEDVQKALKKNRNSIGSRYVEVFRCSFQEVERYMNKHTERRPEPRRERSRSRDRGRDMYDEPPRMMRDPPPRPRVMTPPRIPISARYESSAAADMRRFDDGFYPPAPERPPSFGIDMGTRLTPIEPYGGLQQSLYPSPTSARLSEIERLERLNAARALELEMRMAAAPPPPPPRLSAGHPHPPPPMMHPRTFCVQMEGFPYDCTRHELLDFLSPARPTYVEFIKDAEGKVKEAMAEFDNPRDFETALSKHRNFIGKRWIAVREHPGSGEERRMEPPPPPRRRERSRSPLRRPRSPPKGPGRHLLKVLGLPFDCDEFDIQDFFIKVARPVSINIRRDPEGRCRDAIVEFSTYDQMLSAEKLDRQFIKHRYVDIKRL